MKVHANKHAYINCNFSNKNTCCEFKHGYWKEAQGRQLSLSNSSPLKFLCFPNLSVFKQNKHEINAKHLKDKLNIA
jgi:hypothetical protein